MLARAVMATALPSPWSFAGPLYFLITPGCGKPVWERSQHKTWTHNVVMDPFNLGLLLLQDYLDNFAGKGWEEAARSRKSMVLLAPASVPGFHQLLLVGLQSKWCWKHMQGWSPFPFLFHLHIVLSHDTKSC